MGYILLPYIFNIIEKKYNDNIEKRVLKKRLVIILIITILLFFFETNYLNSTQRGIIEMYSKKITVQSSD